MVGLVDKLEGVDRGGTEEKVVGCTWWSRLLACPTNPTMDLEDWWAATFPSRPLPTPRTAPVVAMALAQAVAEVARRAGTNPSSGKFLASIGLDIRMGKVVREREVLVICNSFKPDTITSFTVDKMDQVSINSGDEYFEVEENVECEKRVKVEVDENEETLLISSDSEENAGPERVKEKNMLGEKEGRKNYIGKNLILANVQTSPKKNYIEQVLELGQRSTLRRRVLLPGPQAPATHDWQVWVRNPNGDKIEKFIRKVVFNLHETFPNRRRTVHEPPFMIQESGHGGFMIHIDLYFMTHRKKITVDYELILQPFKEPGEKDYCPVLSLHRLERMQFPIEGLSGNFRNRLFQGGAKRVEVREGASSQEGCRREDVRDGEEKESRGSKSK